MEQRRQVTLLGDSILKGIQVDLSSRRYRSQNEINVGALESEFQLSIHNDAHFGATVRKGSRLLDRLLERKLPCDMLVMDFGGNDCDFRWKEIAEAPEAEHLPNVPTASVPSLPTCRPWTASAFSTGGAGTWIRKPFSAGWGTWAISTPGRSDIPGR